MVSKVLSVVAKSMLPSYAISNSVRRPKPAHRSVHGDTRHGTGEDEAGALHDPPSTAPVIARLAEPLRSTTARAYRHAGNRTIGKS
jgi:hypothetical protein